MQAAVSSVNCGLNEKPRPSKKVMERFRSLTAMLTKSFRGLVAGMANLQSGSDATRPGRRPSSP